MEHALLGGEGVDAQVLRQVEIAGASGKEEVVDAGRDGLLK